LTNVRLYFLNWYTFKYKTVSKTKPTKCTCIR